MTPHKSEGAPMGNAAQITKYLPQNHFRFSVVSFKLPLGDASLPPPPSTLLRLPLPMAYLGPRTPSSKASPSTIAPAGLSGRARCGGARSIQSPAAGRMLTHGRQAETLALFRFAASATEPLPRDTRQTERNPRNSTSTVCGEDYTDALVACLQTTCPATGSFSGPRTVPAVNHLPLPDRDFLRREARFCGPRAACGAETAASGAAWRRGLAVVYRLRRRSPSGPGRRSERDGSHEGPRAGHRGVRGTLCRPWEQRPFFSAEPRPFVQEGEGR